MLGVPVDSVAAPAEGPPFGTELSPAVLRDLGLVGGWRERTRGPGRADNRPGPRRGQRHCRLAERRLNRGRDPAGVTGLLADGRAAAARWLLHDPDGAAPAARDVLGRVGLAYVDGHVDVYDNRTSPTGEAADMPVAALLGRGWPDLLAAMGATPVIDGRDMVLMGARDQEEAADIGDLPDQLGLTMMART